MPDDRPGFGPSFAKEVQALYMIRLGNLITDNEFRDSLRKAYPNLELGPNEIDLDFDPTFIPSFDEEPA